MQHTPTNSGNNSRSSHHPLNRANYNRNSQSQLSNAYSNHGGYVHQPDFVSQQLGSSDAFDSSMHNIQTRSSLSTTYNSDDIYSPQYHVNAHTSQHTVFNIVAPPPMASSSYNNSIAQFSSTLPTQGPGARLHMANNAPSSASRSSAAFLGTTQPTFTNEQSTSYAFPRQSNPYVSTGSSVLSASDTSIRSHANSPAQSLNVGASAGFTGMQAQPSLATPFVPASPFTPDASSSPYVSGLIDPTELARRYDLDAIAEREKADAQRLKAASRDTRRSSPPSILPSSAARTASRPPQGHPSQSPSLQFITEDPTSMARVISNSPSSHRIDPQARLRDTNKSPCARCKRSHIKCNMTAPYSSDLCEACAKKKLRVCEGGPQLFDL